MYITTFETSGGKGKVITVNTSRKLEEELEEETRGNPKIKYGRDLCMFIGCGEGVSG